MNVLTASALVLFSALLPVTEDTWPAFRGDGSNVAPAQSLPITWSENSNLAWVATPEGYGQSSPVIWKDRLFVTSVVGEEKETSIVSAFAFATGAQVWQHKLDSAQRIKSSNAVSKAAPTPVVDQDGVYVFFESGDLIALDHQGRKRWQRNLVDELGVAHERHGLGNSLAQNSTKIFLLIESANPSVLAAIDKATGEDLWKIDRGGRTAWTSPVVAEVNGVPSILISSANSFAQYNAETGEELRLFEGLSGISIPSPALDGNIAVIGANSTRPAEGDRTPRESNCAIELSEDGKSFNVLWEGDRAQADYASPLIHNGYVYIVTARGDLQCRELATGEIKYTERVHPCWATPLVADGHIYLFGKDGDATVVKAGPEFEVIAQNRLWSADPPAEGEEASPFDTSDNTVYAIAAANDTLIVRTGDRVFAIRQSAE